MKTVGEPYSGKPNVRFDEGRPGKAAPNRAAYSTFVRGYVKAIRLSHGLRITRIVGGSLVHAVEMVGATLFLIGYLPGLYIAAVAIVTNTCYMITAAWLLIVGVFDQSANSLKS